MKASEPLSHARALELLPWLVNGSLGPAERDAVEQHVRSCITCRRELREQQRLQSAIRAQPTVHVTSQLGFEQLDREIDGEARTPAARWRRGYAAAGPFAIAAAAGLALLAFLLWLSPPHATAPSPYTTLASPGGEDELLDVVFTQDTTTAEVRALLERIGGEIVGGPSSLGRYRIHLTDDTSDSSAEALERAIAELDADPHVRLVTRALAEDAP